jgi:hypothetical protein
VNALHEFAGDPFHLTVGEIGGIEANTSLGDAE